MTAVIARIVLRYAAGALLVRGLLSPDDAATVMNDPDLQMLAGAALGALAESWWALAHKYGWAK